MDERVFFEEGMLRVTSSRVEVGGHTFATRNIGSVKIRRPGASVAGLLIAILGALLLLRGSETAIFAVCMLAGGGVWAWSTYMKRELILVAGGGEVKALTTNNAALAERLRAAVAEAISVR